MTKYAERGRGITIFQTCKLTLSRNPFSEVRLTDV
jgi:hypothetical protein